jgi:hypothetical protein
MKVAQRFDVDFSMKHILRKHVAIAATFLVKGVAKCVGHSTKNCLQFYLDTWFVAI